MIKIILLSLNPFSPMNWFVLIFLTIVYFILLKKMMPKNPKFLKWIIMAIIYFICTFMIYTLACMLSRVLPIMAIFC